MLKDSNIYITCIINITIEEISEGFSEYIRAQTKDHLRVVAQFKGRETEVLYSKLSQEKTDLKVRNMIERLEQMKAIDSEEELGQRYGCVQVRGEAVLVHVPKKDDEGYLLDFETGAARNLVGFLDDCHEFLSTDLSSK
jgi:hypothetical protein